MKHENQYEYWNEVAKVKKFTTSLNIKLFSKLLNKNSKILDYGCGYGRTLNDLYLNGYKNLIGFDYANEMIERGKTEFPYLDLNLSSDNIIDYPSNSVDMVTLFAVVTCIITDKPLKALIQEIKRVLKPTGYIYINDFLINTDDRNKKRYEKYAKKYQKYGVFELTEGAVLRHYHKKYIFELLNGFKDLYYKEHTFKTMNGNSSNGFVYLGKQTNL